MSSNPPRRRWFGGRTRAEAPPHTADGGRWGPTTLADLTTAFLESERVLAEIDADVTAAYELEPRTRVRGAWTTLRERYGQATDEYLRVSQLGQGRARPDEIGRTLTALHSATEEMRRFGQAHATELTRARHAVHETQVLDHRARVAATSASTALEHAPDDLAGLRTVASAAASLTDAVARFEQAAGLRDRRQAAQAVVTAAANVETVLTDAPGYAARADRVIRSVETRRGAIVTRSEQIPAAMSALRREFSTDCSVDLQDNDAIIARQLGAADADLAHAKQHLTSAADQAIVDAEAARDDLDTAEQAVDAVLDRLRMLRAVRENPGAEEQRVRFRLRDAQQFALNNGLVDAWGTVLDAQADRIERAKVALRRIHPDYWTYLSELRAVDRRIAEIIDRMRGEVADR
ncbi:hypothetical protein GCM10009624_34990 [Gordonia sinesedis]